MRKRRLFLLLIGVGVLFGVLMAISARYREPEYDGKKLSEWVDMIWSPPTGNRQDNIRLFETIPTAFRSMGTNTLPYLLKWSRDEPGLWNGRIAPFISICLGWVNSDWHVPKTDATAYARRDAARYALLLLLDDTNRPTASLMTDALRKIDPGTLERLAR